MKFLLTEIWSNKISRSPATLSNVRGSKVSGHGDRDKMSSKIYLVSRCGYGRKQPQRIVIFLQYQNTL